METLKIKAILLAARYRSLSKAAEVFSYTPSALSHSVDALENELGVKLLNRSYAGVEWTEEGMQLQEKLEAVVKAEEKLIQAAQTVSGRKQEQLRIGTYSSIAVNLLPEILNGFKEAHPNIGITITVGNKLDHWLSDDIADVLLGTKEEENCWKPLFQDHFVAVLPKTFFPGMKSIHYEALYPYTFITTDNVTDYLHVAQNFALEKFKDIIVLNSEDDLSAVSMVREGIGVTILPFLVLKNNKKGVRLLKFEPELYRTIGVSTRKDCDTDSAAAKFARYIKEYFEMI